MEEKDKTVSAVERNALRENMQSDFSKPFTQN